LSSSSGPVIPIRWCKLRAEMRRAVAVMVRSGLSTRPAISQPRPTEATAMMPSATPDSMSSWSRVSLRRPAAACWTQSFICATVGSVPSAGVQAATPAPVPPAPPVTTGPLVPAVPPPLVPAVPPPLVPAVPPPLVPAVPPPLVPAVPPPLVRSVTVPGNCRATRKYVMTSKHAAEARKRPT